MIRDNKLPPHNKPKSSIHTVVVVKPSNQAKHSTQLLHPSSNKSNGKQKPRRKANPRPQPQLYSTIRTWNIEQAINKQTPFPPLPAAFSYASDKQTRHILCKHDDKAWLM
jgi:hypothetical protein